MKTKMTLAEICLRNYLLLIIKSLNYCKTYTVEELSFNTEDERIIRDHFKDTTQKSVIQAISPEECVAIFKGHLSRLITGNNSEWTKIAYLQKRHRILFNDIEIQSLNEIYLFFLKKKTGGLSEK